MSKVLVIAEREIRERAFVFVTAVALAIAPFLALLIPRGQVTPPLQVVAVFSAVIAAAFVVGLSILLGVSTVGHELVEKRLSFYFARPLNGRAIWMGKLAAVAAILLISATIAFAPAVLFAPADWGGIWSLPVSRLITITLLFSTGAFAFAHAASTMVRSRSPLILLDFAAALLFLGLVGVLLAPLLSHGAIALFVLLLVAIAAIAILILLIAPAWQLQRARTDVRRNHFELSRFIWSCCGALLLAIALFVAWVQRVAPQDLDLSTTASVRQTASGVIISGPARYRLGYRASFLLDPQTGRSREIAAKDSWTIRDSSRGTAIIWSNSPVSVLDILPGAGTRERAWTVMCATAADHWAGHEVFAGSGSGREGWPSTLAISDDGTLALVVRGDIAAIYDVPRHRLAAAVRLPFKPYIYVEASFISPRLVRIFASGVNDSSSGALVLDVDPTTRRVHQTMALAGAGRRLLLFPLAGGTRAFASWRGLSREATVRDARIYDASTGREIAAFTGDPKPREVRALRDGRLVSRSFDGNRASLRVYDANARLLRNIDFGPGSDEIVRPDLLDGRIIVGTTLGRSSQPKEWTTSVVDIDRGVIARQAGLLPLRTGRFQFFPQMPVFIDEQYNLVTWDVTTNQRRVLLASK